jgi:hypothetical protein
MLTWVLRGSGSSRSKLAPAQCLWSSGDGVRGEGLVGGR